MGTLLIIIILILILIIYKKSGEKTGQTIVNKDGCNPPEEPEEVKDKDGLTLTDYLTKSKSERFVIETIHKEKLKNKDK